MLKNFVIKMNKKYNVQKWPIWAKTLLILFFIACLYALYLETSHLLSITNCADCSDCSSVSSSLGE